MEEIFEKLDRLRQQKQDMLNDNGISDLLSLIDHPVAHQWVALDRECDALYSHLRQHLAPESENEKNRICR